LAIGSATHAGHSGQKVGITAYFVEFCSCRLMGDGAQGISDLESGKKTVGGMYCCYIKK